MCATLRLSTSEIIRLHIEKEYRVFMIGFQPGFPYMGIVDERIAFPRKEKPARRVAQGSIGIAGQQTGIYPFDSPGGWSIIGRTPLSIFNQSAIIPALFQPGDLVTFYPISANEFANFQAGNP
jgi:inhibitor of KinA